MAADSRVCAGSLIYECNDKIKIVGGRLVGTAGETGPIAKFLAWLEHPVGDAPEFTEDALSVIALGVDGLSHYGDSVHGTVITQQFLACGSGADAAMAAMYCGKTPAEAVAIAIKCDVNSGGKVHVYDFNNGKPKRRK